MDNKMIQDDSNGESSFEIIDKKNRENGDRSECSSTLSAVSSAYSIPSPSAGNVPSGNLLSNVAPPSSLPDFTLWPSSIGAETQPSIVPTVSDTQIISAQPQISIPNLNIVPSMADQFPKSEFSAAIPPSKGFQHGPVAQPKSNEGENFSGGFMGLVKEAFSTSGGVLSKMAEKAKSSVDSIITTLDPQMSEYIYSSGDTEVTVTSENEEEVGAVRESFHAVLGKAWVNGIKLNLPPRANQAVGFEAGMKNAQEKIEYSLKYRKTPTVAIENILIQQNDCWFDLSMLVLKDMDKQITVHTFSQATPVPVDQFLRNIESERPDSKTLSTEEKLALYLQAIPGWQMEISGVSRKEIIALAAKTLARIYKNKMAVV